MIVFADVATIVQFGCGTWAAAGSIASSIAGLVSNSASKKRERKLQVVVKDERNEGNTVSFELPNDVKTEQAVKEILRRFSEQKDTRRGTGVLSVPDRVRQHMVRA